MAFMVIFFFVPSPFFLLVVWTRDGSNGGGGGGGGGGGSALERLGMRVSDTIIIVNTGTYNFCSCGQPQKCSAAYSRVAFLENVTCE